MEGGSRLQIAAGVVLISCLLAVVKATDPGCNVDEVRDLSRNQVPGGWRVNNSTTGGIVAERAIAQLKSSNGNTAHITKHQRVIEAFSQVVAGSNYCVLFSASGKCDSYHCKSFECTAKGHLPIDPSTRDDDVQIKGVQCVEQMVTCDIESVANLAKTPMPGGWFNSTSNNEKVIKLHQTASTIANIEHGEIVEAYSQVVAGFNYCIRFRSSGVSNCARNCQPVMCTASGFAPLSQQSTTNEAVIKVGVNCHPDGAVLQMGASHSSSSRLFAQLGSTLLIAILASFL